MKSTNDSKSERSNRPDWDAFLRQQELIRANKEKHMRALAHELGYKVVKK